MAAARANEVVYHEDGSVELGGVRLAPDEVEILATPMPGTAVAHDEGIVVVIDTALTPEAHRGGRRPGGDPGRPGPAQAGGAGARRTDPHLARWPDGRAGIAASASSGHRRRTASLQIEEGPAPPGAPSTSVRLDAGR